MKTKSLVLLVLAAGAMIGALSGCGDDSDSGGSGGATSASSTDASSTTSDATSTSDASSTSGTGGSTGDPTCEAYCTSIMANCLGEVAQYGTMESCMGACAGLDLGTGADMAGNTVGCRTYHAGVAATDPATHCAHAGPGGAAVCGDNCEGFCAIAMSACTGADQQYADEAECMTDCATFADTEPYDVSDTSSNTLACRLYHLTVAATDAASATAHCGHITSASPVCVN